MVLDYAFQQRMAQDLDRLLEAVLDKNLLLFGASIACWQLCVNTRAVTSCSMGYHPALKRNRPEGARARRIPDRCSHRLKIRHF